jgi:hypothetical protein
MAKDSTKVFSGVGTIYVAPYTAAAPTTATATLEAAWVELGYTESGLKFEYTTELAEVEVAEEMSPVGYIQTKETGKVSFECAQSTAFELSLLLNQGSAVTATSVTKIEPVAYASMAAVSIILKTDQGALYYFKKALNGGTLTLERSKSEKTKIAGEFNLMKVTGSALFSVFPANGTYQGAI